MDGNELKGRKTSRGRPGQDKAHIRELEMMDGKQKAKKRENEEEEEKRKRKRKEKG